MDIRELLERYKPHIRKNWIPLGLGILGLIFLGYGLIGLLGTSTNEPDIVFESEENNDSASDDSRKTYVDISGAVVNPGVFELENDSRIKDALVAASGLSDEADRDWVSRNINLAAKVSDGVKIYIPREGEAVTGTFSNTLSGSSEGTQGSININTASESELDLLPGIGPVTAEKIISNRPYASVDELLSKKAVGKATFEKIKDKVSIY